MQALDSCKLTCRQEILQDIFDLKNALQCKITIVWIPAHVGVKGNEKADKLAKEGLQHHVVDLNINPETKEQIDKIDKEILELWQQTLNNSNIAKLNKQVQPRVNFKIKFTDPNRRKEVCLTRLRLGVCKLKYYLKLQKNHQSGLCSTCGVEETIVHHLLNCRGNKIGSELRDACALMKIKYDINSVLNNKKTLDIIYSSLSNII